MIIGHYEHEIWAKGGIASYIRRVSAAQAALGHQVHFLSRQPSVGANDFEQPIVVPTEIELYQQAQKLGLDILHLHRPVHTRPPAELPAIRTLHGHQPYCPSGSRYLNRWQKPCDRAYSLHGCLWGSLVDHCGSIRPHNLLHNFQETWHEMATLATIPVITVSHFLKDQMVRSGYAAEMIQVLHLMPPDMAELPPLPQGDQPHFVFLGRISPAKGVAWLLRALQQVSVPIHVDIAGEGDQELAMRELCKDLQLDDRVTFHGWVDRQQVEALIRQARAIVFPSIWHEPGGTIAFEAMVQSRPVIMSRVGGMPEVVLDEVNGLLADPNDIAGLAACIERLAIDGALAQSMGEAGRKMATEQYALSIHIEKLMNSYRQVIQVKQSVGAPSHV
jgi:glycosyltransferase involved in cell wall biosynthesis